MSRLKMKSIRELNETDLKYFKEISSKINSDFKNMEMTTPTPLKNPGDLKRQK